MIIPEPETDLSLNLMVVSVDVIEIIRKILNKKEYTILDELIDKFIEKDSRRSIDLLLDSLTFLCFIDVIYFKDYKIIMKGKKRPTQIDEFF